jgi:glycosyltransferase involved in cell wall biosynthesis
MKFGIITYIQHKDFENIYFSYAPYINEMNIWLRYVNQAYILAPSVKKSPDIIDAHYNKSIQLKVIPSIEFTSLKSSIFSLLKLPLIFYRIIKFFFQVDHIHLRCPGNISLIGCIVQIFFPMKSKSVKYAGNWDPKSKQPWSYELQRWILSNSFLSKNIKVLTYGQWPNQSKNIIPFFTATFSENEIEEPIKNFESSFKFIFVGSLTEGKRPLFAIKLIKALRELSLPVSLALYGDGVLRKDLHKYIVQNRLNEFIELKGNRSLTELKEVYRTSHFLILASKSEGWPKAVAEAMFFGCVPISTSVSCVSWMLGGGERGILIDAELSSAIKIIKSTLENKVNLELMSKRAQDWSSRYTLEKFELEIQKLL